MIKRFSMLLVVMLTVFTARAFAQDFWVFTDSNGGEYYVMNDTIINKTEYKYNRKFDVKVKYVARDSAREPIVSLYHFWENDGMQYYRIDGDDEQDFQFVYKDTAAQKVREYCLKYLGIDYVLTFED